MKVIKGLAILSFFSILFGSCFDPPQFPETPEIVFQDVVFCDVADNSKPDSLILYIKFKDGDGDLGLDAQDPVYSTPPYQYADFFLGINGGFVPVVTVPGQITGTEGFIDFLEIPNPVPGRLVFPRTRKDPVYANLLPTYSCVDYEYREFIIEDADIDALDDISDIQDTLAGQGGSKFYLVRDTLYLEANPDHHNIEVDFLIKEDPNNPDPDKRFVEYDWRKERCTTFDGRFPFLSETNTALDGSLKYTMESRGFKILFGGKTIKLRIQIKDRALHRSNIIETDEFTLNGILRCN